MKRVLFVITLAFLVIMAGHTVQAATTFDTSKTSSGLLTVTTDASVSTKTIKLKVENTADSSVYYAYTIKTNSAFSVPLQMGDGTYKASLLENTTGNSYRVVDSAEFSVKVTSPTDMYLSASPIVNFSSSMTSIKAYAELIKSNGASDSSGKLNVLYGDVTKNYVYDTAKASSVASDYVPNIDTMYSSKKGICYDYAAIMAAVMRDQGVPTRLCMGYAPEIDVYHAWNQVYINSEWVTLDTTYDAVYVQAGYSVTMKKDSSKFTVMKTY